MLKEIQDKLEPLCRRERLVRMLGRASTGVLVGGVLATALGLLAMLLPSSLLRIAAIACLFVGAGIGLATAMLIRKDWVTAARAVDARFALSDRTLTALTCAVAAPARSVDQLQIRDALAHLQQVNPLAAARQRIDWRLQTGAMVSLVLALAVTFWPESKAEPPPNLVEAVQREFVPQPIRNFEVAPEVAIGGMSRVSQRRDARSVGRSATELTRGGRIRRYYEHTQPLP